VVFRNKLAKIENSVAAIQTTHHPQNFTAEYLETVSFYERKLNGVQTIMPRAIWSAVELVPARTSKNDPI
jgi:hypothetical protein